MAVQRSKATNKLLYWAFCVVCISLSLYPQCSSDSSEDVIQPSNYYFSLPMFNFGAYFYVAFPNNTLQTLYDMFCDIRLLQLTLTYEWFEELNRDRFPYYYEITETDLLRAPHFLLVENVYSANILCDTLTQARAGQITCQRMRLDDDLCDRYKCLEYSLQLNSTACSFACSMLLFNAEYDLKILYFNFGEFPEPVKDGVCVEPDEEMQSSVVRSTSSTDSFSSTTAVMNSTRDYTTTTSTTEFLNPSSPAPTDSAKTTRIPTNHQPVELERSENKDGGQSSPLPIPVLVGSVAGGIFLVLLALTALVCYRRSESVSSKTSRSESISRDGSYTSGSTDLSAVSAERGTSETDNSSGDSPDSGNYHTLDEMSESFGHVSSRDECDEQGYNIIRDCETKRYHSPRSKHGKRSRPLPSPPNSSNHNNFTQSLASGGTSCTGQSQNSSDAMISSLPISTDSEDLGLPPPSYPFSYRRLPNSSNPTAVSPPLPRPHKRLVDLDNHTYLGLVNLRHDQALFGHVTELKLVRTQDGQLELVDAQGESPAFSDYYTRVLLINEMDGAVGVLGVLDFDGASNTGGLEAEDIPRDRKDFIQRRTYSSETYHDRFSTKKVIKYEPPIETNQGRFAASENIQPAEYMYIGTNHDKSLTEENIKIGRHIETNCNRLSTTGYVKSRPYIGTKHDRISTNENRSSSVSDISGLDLYIIYFGPVSLSKDVNVSPCDYLTALDINPGTIATGSDGYLTVLDLDDIKAPSGSNTHL